MLSLGILAVLTGILTTLVIRRTTDARALRGIRNKIQAHLLEFRLFFDEPSLTWKAQINLLHDHARLFRLLLPPALILVLPMTWLFLQFDIVYGLRPLRPGEPAIVTAQLTRPIEATDRFDLQGAAGIAVETLPIRVYRENQIAWRIRPGDAYGAVDLTINGLVIRKTVVTGDSPKFLSPRRFRSLAEFILHPEEPRLPDSNIAWVEVDYPEASATWMVWFLAISTVAALTAARWMKAPL